MRLLEGLATRRRRRCGVDRQRRRGRRWSRAVEAADPQERAAGRRGPGRRRGLRLRRAVRRPRSPSGTTTYGDLETGYIVTPTLPDGTRADARASGAPRPVERPGRARAVQEYAARQPDAARGRPSSSSRWSPTLLDDAGINYLSVTGRAKSVASFAAKADRTVDGVPLYPDPLREITDQIGVRVITYVHSDVAAVADLLARPAASCSTTATWARRPPARAGSATPAGTC